jgi:DNA-binding NarL/FixJ family response regulator
MHFAPDVLLMDIGLPGISGIETVERLRRRHPGSRVLMLTVHEDNDRIFDALCAGACGYLSKSASPDEVAQAVRDVVGGGSAMTPQIARRVIDMFAQLHAPQHDYGLTDRELDVLRELARGKSKKRIAGDLHLSVHTVDTHLRSVYQKMHVSTATQAVGKAVGERLV